jgi:hypothetical protein
VIVRPEREKRDRIGQWIIKLEEQASDPRLKLRRSSSSIEIRDWCKEKVEKWLRLFAIGKSL